MTGIYKITSPNGRIYIGQAINIETGKLYDSIIDASISENINYNCLVSYLRGTNKNKTALRYAE